MLISLRNHFSCTCCCTVLCLPPHDALLQLRLQLLQASAHLKNRVWRWRGILRTIFWIWGSNPMSSIRSASSSTRYDT